MPSAHEHVTTTPDGRPTAEQPIWRQDFPIDQPQDAYIARRDFAKFMVLTSFAFVVGQFWIGLQNLLRRRRGELPVRRIAGVADVPVRGALPFHYPTRHDPCLLLRLDDRTFVAYSSQCTHLMCPVLPEFAQRRLHCPCHRGYFDMATGVPTAGPPRRPLPRIELEIRDGVIYATGVEVRT